MAEACKECRGFGEVARELSPGIFEADECGIIWDRCPICDGSGEKPEYALLATLRQWENKP